MRVGTKKGIWLALPLLAATAAFPPPGTGRGAGEGRRDGGGEGPPKGEISLTVEYSTYDYGKDMAADAPKAVLVTLVTGGRAVRSRELRHAQWVVWRGLAAGTYELHVESEGYARCVKHLTLRAEDKGIKVRALVGKRPMVLGAAPSLEELLARLKKLEEKNAELTATVGQLRKDIERRQK
jgi:hypothetical protein